MFHKNPELREKFKKAAKVLRSLDHDLRIRIIMLLDEIDCPIDVTSIRFGLRRIGYRPDQPTISQHLAVLRKSGVLIGKRDGQFVYYWIDYDRIDQIAQVVNKLADKQSAQNTL